MGWKFRLPLEKEEVMGRGGKFSLVTGHLRTTHRGLLQVVFNVQRAWHSPHTGPRIFRPHPTDVGCVFIIPHNQRTFPLGGVLPPGTGQPGAPNFYTSDTLEVSFRKGSYPASRRSWEPISIPRVPSGAWSFWARVQYFKPIIHQVHLRQFQMSNVSTNSQNTHLPPFKCWLKTHQSVGIW